MASFSVYQQPDESWSWKILDEGRRLIMCVNPGYDSACEAAHAGVATLGGPYRDLAVRLAATFESREKR